MEQIRQYLLTIICASVFCGILEAIPTQKGGSEALRKLICGLFLTATVASPLARIDLSQWVPGEISWSTEAQALAQEGAATAQAERNARIISSAEAYILDKADALEVSLHVEVMVSEEGVPEAVTLSGHCSPYARQMLMTAIASDLGIPKEHQRWIG